MKVLEVKQDKVLQKEFLQFPVKLYRKEKNYIRPLDKDVEKVFDTKKNKFFRHGECIRWILKSDDGKTIGKVAAFINEKTKETKDSKGTKFTVGGMGFFDCIEDEKAAFFLFDTCVAWLKERGVQVMEGPINFGERDQWWGLLIHGFDLPPNLNMPYNFPYYEKFFKSYGFEEYFQQYTFARKMGGGIADANRAKWERINSDPGYEFKQLDPKDFDKYVEDFRIIYNAAWVKHLGIAEMTTLQAKTLFKQMKPIMDPRIALYAYFNGEPVAFFLMIPEANQVLKYAKNGKLDLWAKIKIGIFRNILKANKKALGLVFGVVPSHQGKGMEGALAEYCRIINCDELKLRYPDIELNWIGSFNPKMLHVCGQLEFGIKKRHATLRYAIDKSVTLEAHPNI